MKLYLFVLLFSLPLYASAKDVTGEGEFVTPILDFSEKNGYEIAKQKALADAASKTNKMIDVSQSVLSFNDKETIARNISVLSPALLKEKTVEQSSSIIDGKKVFSVSIVASFDDDYNNYVNRFFEQSKNLKNMIEDLKFSQDELRNSQIKIEGMTNNSRISELNSALSANALAKKSFDENKTRTLAYLSPIAIHSVKKQIEMDKEEQANKRDALLNELRIKEYMENMKYIGVPKLRDTISNMSSVTFSSITFREIDPSDAGKYGYKSHLATVGYDWALLMDKSDEICSIITEYFLARSCNSQVTRSGYSITLVEPDPVFVSDFRLIPTIERITAHGDNISPLVKPSKDKFSFNIGGYGLSFVAPVSFPGKNVPEQLLNELKLEIK
jgi:hypothetical protein